MEFDIGNVFGKTIEVIKERLGPLVGLWAVYLGITIVYTLVFGGVLIAVGIGGAAGLSAFDESAGLSAFAGLGLGLISFVILFYLGFIYLTAAQSCSFAAMGAPYNRPLLGEALNIGFKAALPMLGVMVLLLILYFIGALVLGGLTAVLGQSGGDAIGVVLAVLFIPALIYIACRLSLMIPIAANDGVRNPVKIITRSWSLAGGNVLQIFLILLLYVIALAIFAVALFSPVFLTAQGGAEPGALLVLYMILAYLVFLIAITVSQSVIVAVMHGLLTSATGEDLGDVFE